ncbi:helix-turn-helix domain-containing protein [Streptomyces sp. NPDC002537]
MPPLRVGSSWRQPHRGWGVWDAKGLTMRGIARALHYDPAYLSRVLNGKQQPSEQLVAALERLLGAGDSLTTPVTGGRQSFVSNCEADIQHIRDTIGHLLEHDNRYGGDGVASAAVQVLRVGKGKLDSGEIPDESLVEYLATVAEIAEIAGWLLFDADQQEESRSAFLESHMLARHAGDKPMAWFALDMLAMHGIEHGRPGEALRIADGILSDPRTPPRVALLARIRRARALAITGARQPSLNEFAAARSALGESITTRDPSWTWWVDDRELTGHEGEALLVRGEPSAAVPKLQRALELSVASDTNRRVNLYYSVALLTAYASAQAWRECETTLLSISAMLEIVASGRSRHRLRLTLREIIRAPSAPCWLSDLAREIAATLQLSCRGAH